MTRLSNQTTASSSKRGNDYEQRKAKKRQEQVTKNAIKIAFPKPKKTGIRGALGL